jgi:endonuclease/exonuclease/phosphatase family metal-dependent hydrolase
MKEKSMKFKLFTILILISLTFGCISEDTEQTVQEIVHEIEQIEHNEGQAIEDTQPEVLEDIQVNTSSDETLRIGSFNIQIFGVSKADKPEVMEVLADIVRTYDILAIQEIRDKSQTALPELVELVNSDGSNYEFVVSERMGRTTSKEQYAYLYNTDTILITSEALPYPEPEGTDPFHRQPYIASFRAVNGNYDAVLIVVHTDPDEATEEINALDEALEHAQNVYSDEQDFIILGDFNADGSYFDEDSSSDLDDYYWVIDDTQDTTTKATDYTYDRIILTDYSDFTGEFGVHRFDLEYNLTYDETVAVSDHYPVYAEFNISGDLD